MSRRLLSRAVRRSGALARTAFDLPDANSTAVPVFTPSKVHADRAATDGDLRDPAFGTFAPRPIDFSNTAEAYRGRPTWDLLQALGIFHICSYKLFVENADVVLEKSKQWVGEGPVNWAVRNTFFKHFCGGKEKASELDPILKGLKNHSISTVLCYSAEAHLSEEDGSGPQSVNLNAAIEENLQMFIESIYAASRAPENRFAAIKLTAICRPGLLEKIGNAAQNCSESENAVDRFASLEACLDKVRRGGSVDNVDLTAKDVMELDSVVKNVGKIADAAAGLHVRVLVDAEHTCFQTAIDYITVQAQRKYNKHFAVLLNTYQCYLKDSYHRTVSDIARARAHSYIFGGKFVRGAYMHWERDRAHQHGYLSPVHDFKWQTDLNYDRCMGEALDALHSGQSVELMVASHNQESIENTVKKMQLLGMNPATTPVYFAQLLGMADFLTYTLGHAGYKVMKLVPYGPIGKVLPYLVRRAQENSDVMGCVGNDVSALKRELGRRFAIRPPNEPLLDSLHNAQKA